MDLMEQQKKLQQEAEKVLEDLELINLLKKYGEPVIIGSMSLGLMTWRDIDFEVICQKIEKDFMAEIAFYLIKNSGQRIDLAVVDNRSGEKPKNPKGIYLGLKYYGDDINPEELISTNEKVWKIDIHFVLEKDSNAIKSTEEIRKKLTPEKIKVILEIKNEIALNPKYRKEIFSTDIYEAVLEEGVNSLEEFKNYLRGLGKEICF